MRSYFVIPSLFPGVHIAIPSSATSEPGSSDEPADGPVEQVECGMHTLAMLSGDFLFPPGTAEPSRLKPPEKTAAITNEQLVMESVRDGCLVGVWFVMDYVQLQFDECIMNVNTDIHFVSPSGERTAYRSRDWWRALCSSIEDYVVRASGVEQESLTLWFRSGARFDIDLTTDLSHLCEAVYCHSTDPEVGSWVIETVPRDS